jgi:hypothetical protein
MSVTTIAPAARTTGNVLLDDLLAAIAAKPGEEVGRVARRAGADKGEAGRVLAYAESIGYVRVVRVKGRRTYLPVA